MKAGDLIRLRIDALAFGGDAVGRAGDGRVVFVAGGAPGDHVEARVDEVKRSHARGRVVRVLSAGAERVAPRCGLVGRCGGCQWQEVSIAAQRAAKQSIVERALGRLGMEVAPLSTPAEDFGYRTRARLAVGTDGALGFSERRSHEVVDVTACPLLHPRLDAALAAARAALGELLQPGATMAGLVGRAPGGAYGDAVQLAVEGAAPAAAGRARALVGRAGIVGVLVEGEAFGAAEIDTSEGDEAPFWATANGFAQASAAGNRALRALVDAHVAARAPRTALELYAGDGNFTRDLVRRGTSVVAVEGAPRAIARLPRNAPGALAVASPAEHEAERRARAGERFDLVLLDPPRTGARALVPALARLTDTIVYVSCDPMTLARDAAELAALGLRPRRVTGVDMMPHTYHVECVCLLSRD